MATERPYEALKELSFLDRGKDLAIQIFFEEWLRHSPNEAQEAYLRYQRNLFERNDIEPWNQISASELIGASMATRDVEAAFSWAQLLDDPQDRERALRGIFDSLVDSDPRKALQQVENFEVDERYAALQSIAKSWAKKDLNEALNWFNDELSQEDQDFILPQLIEGIAETDSKAASEYIQFLPDDTRGKVVGVITNAWAKESPQEAAQWLATDASDDEYRYLLSDVMNFWAIEDSREAETWSLAQPEGEKRNRAIYAYVKASTSGSEEPSHLFELASSELSGDQNLQQLAQIDVLLRWNRLDSDEANRVASTRLSAEALGEFLVEKDRVSYVEP